ncbi:hypothetical protein CRUP_034376 [Coryphaenoides rupestris]|nr:hypothetical protein CRUP_034376 [Coryphaenoides rupestris]
MAHIVDAAVWSSVGKVTEVLSTFFLLLLLIFFLEILSILLFFIYQDQCTLLGLMALLGEIILYKENT